MRVYHIAPYKHGDIGGGINKHIDHLPADCWVCVRDQDTLLFPGQGRLIEKIVEANESRFNLITCRTNRIGVTSLNYDVNGFNDSNMNNHVHLASSLMDRYGTEVSTFPAPYPVPGMFMLFPRTLWRDVGGFKTHSIFFDQIFTQKVREIGGRVGVAEGLFIFHLYRWGSPNPQYDADHLINID